MLAHVGGLGQTGPDYGVLSLSVLAGPTGLLLCYSSPELIGPEESVMNYLLSTYLSSLFSMLFLW